MKDQNTIDKFIALRADGWSYDKISQELKVSKQTLINWGRKYRHDIFNLIQIKKEAMKDEYGVLEHRRIEILGKPLKKIQTEIEKRDFSELPLDKAVGLLIQLTEKLKEEEGKEIAFYYPPDPPAPKPEGSRITENSIPDWAQSLPILQPGLIFPQCCMTDEELVAFHQKVLAKRPWEIEQEQEERKAWSEEVLRDHQNQTDSIPNLDQTLIPATSESKPLKRLEGPL